MKSILKLLMLCSFIFGICQQAMGYRYGYGRYGYRNNQYNQYNPYYKYKKSGGCASCSAYNG